MTDVSGNGTFDSRLDVSKGAQLNASGTKAIAINVGEGSVTLDDGFVSANGTEYTCGIRSISNADETKVMTFKGRTEIAVRSEAMAVGVFVSTLSSDTTAISADSTTIVMEDSATIQAEASNATGVAMYGGSMNVEGEDVYSDCGQRNEQLV